MKLIVEVGGIKVYSDKTLSTINGSMVSFSDGSWCDVVNKQILNRGAGSISLDAPPSGAGFENKKETEAFPGSMILIKNVRARVEVQPYEGADIEVTKEGPENDIKHIRVYASEGMVVAEGDQPSNTNDNVSIGSGININMGSINSGGADMVIGNGSTYISGSNIVIGGRNENIPILSVKVPRGTRVNLSGVKGPSVVGDTQGPFSVVTNGSYDVKAGSVTETSINVQGSSDVSIEQVKKTLEVIVQGSGDVDIEEGDVDSLSITKQGSGDVTYKGIAANANLSSQGSGDIKVSKIINKPVIAQSGSGEIKIKNKLWK